MRLRGVETETRVDDESSSSLMMISYVLFLR